MPRKETQVQQDLVNIMLKHKCSLTEAWARYNEQELEPKTVKELTNEA